MMPNIYEVLRKLRPELEKEENETINYNRYKTMCAKTFTLDRRMVKHTWDILLDMGIFININGRAYKVNHDRILEEMSVKGAS